MIAVMVVLGVRTVLAVQSAAVVNLKVSKEPGRDHGDPLLTAVDRQDSLLRAASVGSRDPFRAWTPPAPVGGSSKPGKAVAPPPPPVVPPRVAVLMDAGSGVIIQIEVEGETSPRLPVGGSFRGWTISGVSATMVTMVKDGKSVSVPRP
ncbi:MAG: hypothetical protein FD129_2276 [bacterium]|nr:MAG: hypothetical protein FD129_2276 [bacterium]